MSFTNIVLIFILLEILQWKINKLNKNIYMSDILAGLFKQPRYHPRPPPAIVIDRVFKQNAGTQSLAIAAIHLQIWIIKNANKNCMPHFSLKYAKKNVLTKDCTEKTVYTSVLIRY